MFWRNMWPKLRKNQDEVLPLLAAGFLLGQFFSPEDGGNMLLDLQWTTWHCILILQGKILYRKDCKSIHLAVFSRSCK
jgi:hypothetical protein